MPRLSKEIRDQIKQISHSDLQNIVLKLAAKDKSVFDYVLVNYLDKEFGEKDLFEQTKADLDNIIWKNYKGFSEQLRFANMLTACIKRINQFTKTSNNKILEADLLMYVLEVPFSRPIKMFGTCFTQYDSKVAIILKRLITIVTKKIHEDYRLNYANKINSYLSILHKNSNNIDTIYNLPQKI